jgi:hypothetical protein
MVEEAGGSADAEPVVCYNGWQEPVEVNLRGHRLALVTHRCRKTILHTTDHECACGRVWVKG